MGFPTKCTLIQAINNGHLNTFPGLTVANVNKFFPESDETQKGHLKRNRQGTRSTKPQVGDGSEPIQKPGIKQREGYLQVFDATKKSMFTDQTGKFPVTSSRSNKYLMVAVEVNGNYINGEPMKSQEAKSLVQFYQAIMDRWSATKVIAPNRHVLDNKCPKELKQAITANDCNIELTPPDMHRCNIDE